MTTTRDFTLTAETGKERIPILFTAFGHVPTQGRPRTIEQIEVEAEIKRALFAVSKAVEGKDGVREYAGDEQHLLLTPGQIELLRQRIVDYPFWNPFQADLVADTYRWLGQ